MTNPQERFALMEKEHPIHKARGHFNGKYWHPIEEPHCICGVLDCPSPIFCDCNEKAEEIAVRLIYKAITK